MEDEIQLGLSKDQAIVLLEFLSRFSDTDKLEIVDQAEQRVLWTLCCDLERVLTEPYIDKYPVQLKEARDRIRDKD